MSMTESEAIERIKEDICHGNPKGLCRDACMYGKGKCAYDMAMRALEEIQQYREYREIFESHFTEDVLKLFSDKEEFSKWFERGKWHVLKCDELGREVEEYRAIGTVSEFRELKEKAAAKKPLAPFTHKGCGNHCCPNCTHPLTTFCEDYNMEYCEWCGQKLDWSEGKE